MSNCQNLQDTLAELKKELEALEKAKNESLQTGQFDQFDQIAENLQTNIETLVQQYLLMRLTA